MATIKDVAKKAGLAISTVSAVINRSAPVSEDAIKRVERAISTVGYVPHAAAQSLRSGRSKLIGLVVPNVANPHFAAVAREVENVCLARGFTSVVYSTGQDATRESQVLTMMRMQRVAGLIIIPTRSDAEHGTALFKQIHVPTVLLDMAVTGLPFDVIKSDNVEVGRLAAEHLINLGHQRIGVIVGIPGLTTSDDRYSGFLRAHREAGLDHDNSLVEPGMFDQEIARKAATRLIGLNQRPTAIIAISNMMTIGLFFALQEQKLIVPQDISVVGIDDMELARLMNPQPTVVATPIREMARRSIELLLSEMSSNSPPTGKWEVLKPKLIVRQSTARF